MVIGAYASLSAVGDARQMREHAATYYVDHPTFKRTIVSLKLLFSPRFLAASWASLAARGKTVSFERGVIVSEQS